MLRNPLTPLIASLGVCAAVASSQTIEIQISPSSEGDILRQHLGSAGWEIELRGHPPTNQSVTFTVKAKSGSNEINYIEVEADGDTNTLLVEEDGGTISRIRRIYQGTPPG